MAHHRMRQSARAQIILVRPSRAGTLVVFVPFALFYMNQPLKLDYLWASLCIMGAVYFVFRG